MSGEVQCFMSMEVTKSLPKTCSESIFFLIPRIESMPSPPPMGEAKRVDDSASPPEDLKYPLVGRVV